MTRFSVPVVAACLCSALCLTACAPRVGIGIPVGPFQLGVGLGTEGVSAGIGTDVGPLGVGVGVQPGGQVTGHAGVGASVPIGAARVGAGVGGSTVLHDPKSGTSSVPSSPIAAPQKPAQWRDAQGNAVPACRVMGGC